MAWPSLKTWTAAVVTVLDMNTEVRDRMSTLKTSIADDGRVSGEIMTFREEVTSVAFSATPTFNLALSNNFALGALTGNVTAITVSGWTASKFQTASILFVQDGSGNHTVAWPAGWKWSNSLVPVVGLTASKRTTVQLVTFDGGTTIDASFSTFNAG